MTQTPSEDPTLLLHAALDGELDAAGMMAIERRLAADSALAAEYARLVALRDAIRARAPRDRAPDALRDRVIAMAQTPSRSAQPVAQRRPSRFATRYAALAASLAMGVILGAGGYGLLAPQVANDDIQRAIVAGFVRGRLSGQPVDVATSDRHTVKPWLAARIAGATTVVDLKSDGFPLVGGRIDIVGQTPVATLIYQRREHQIALSEMPGAGAASASAPHLQMRDGYSILEWEDGGRLYAAVSDLPPAELDAFAAASRRAAASEREDAPKP